MLLMRRSVALVRRYRLLAKTSPVPARIRSFLKLPSVAAKGKPAGTAFNCWNLYLAATHAKLAASSVLPEPLYRATWG